MKEKTMERITSSKIVRVAMAMANGTAMQNGVVKITNLIVFQRPFRSWP